MKRWRIEEAQRLGIAVGTFNRHLYHRKTIPYPPVIRLNKRVVLVLVKRLTEAVNSKR